MFKKRMVRIGIGAFGGLMLLPMINGRFRRKITRAGRDAFFLVSDYIQDITDIKR